MVKVQEGNRHGLSNKTVLVCLACAKRIPNTKHWRRDIQAHFKKIHHEVKLSAAKLKKTWFNKQKAKKVHGKYV